MAFDNLPKLYIDKDVLTVGTPSISTGTMMIDLEEVILSERTPIIKPPVWCGCASERRGEGEGRGGEGRRGRGGMLGSIALAPNFFTCYSSKVEESS